MARRLHRARLALSVDLGDVGAETPLPTEFRLFTAGVSESWKGPALFDTQAAESVMAAAAQWGVDLSIDLEHRSIDPMAVALASDAADALGWFRLAVREDGSLWAVDVRWTAEGERRLRAKTQRYVSPYFEIDAETTRVLRVFNCALTSQPATFGAEALVSASVRPRARASMGEIERMVQGALDDRFGRNSNVWYVDVYPDRVVYENGDDGLWQLPYTVSNGQVVLGDPPVRVEKQYAPVAQGLTARAVAKGRRSGMDPKLIADALEALIAGDEAKCAEILKGLVVSAAGGDPSATDAEPPPAAEGAPDALPESLTQAASVLASLARAARELTGKDSVGEAVAALRSVFADRDAAAAREAERAAVLDLSSRRELIATLVSIGAETPATAWARTRADGTECAAEDRVPCARLAAEPLAELRARTEALRVARGGASAGRTAQPPVAASVDAADGLTESETRAMNKLPENKRAEYRALRLARRAQ